MSKRPSLPKEKPTKPLTHYFQFRNERLAALKDQDNRNEIVKQEWNNLSEEIKEAGKERYKKELEKYHTLMADWRKGHPDEKSKKIPKKEQESKDDDDEEQPKAEKAKAAGKAQKGKGKKEEEVEVKPEKARSKGKEKEKEKFEQEKSKRAKKWLLQTVILSHT